MPDQFSPPWLPWFHRDFIAATAGWTLLERGAYFMLLGAQWEIGPLPSDRRRLAIIIGAQMEELESVWPVVGSKFTATAEGLVNERLEQHRLKQKDRSEKASQSARRRWPTASESGANAPANDQANPPANGYANRDAQGHAKSMLPDPDPDPNPIPIPSKNSRPPKRTVPVSFHLEVIDLYHEVLPDLPAVKVWDKGRPRLLDARIHECCKRGKAADKIAYWRELFETVAASDFLCRRTPGSRFRASLEWILRPENFVKVIEGQYDNRQGNGTAHAP